MTTDVINDVPRDDLDLIRAVLEGFNPCMARDDALRTLRRLLATAQPADHSEHDLNMVSQPAADAIPCAGANCGTTTAQHSVECLREAAKHQGWKYEEEQPAADGEREAFEAWAASVGYHTERDMFQREKYQSSLTWELWRVWQPRAAQPQQAVAVTDEVRRLREALGEAVEYLDSTPFNEIGAGSILHRTMRDALSAHKTGEEE